MSIELCAFRYMLTSLPTPRAHPHLVLVPAHAEISPSGSGWVIYNAVHQRGYVGLQDLVQWFHLIQQAMQLGQFFEATFEDVRHVFQQGERHR